MVTMSTRYEKMTLGMPDYEALCGLCEIPLEGPVNPKPDDTLRCPKCGNIDTLANVNRVVLEYLEEYMAKTINNLSSKIARSSKTLTFKSGFRPKGAHRFMVNLESH